MPTYITPKYLIDVFTCPYCDVTAKQKWYGRDSEVSAHLVSVPGRENRVLRFAGEVISDAAFTKWLFSKCEHCGQITVWHNDEIVHPFTCPVNEPNADMPTCVKDRYIEASRVMALSPASAAALLRLALQLLLKEVLQEESSGNIFEDIMKLKKSTN